MWLIKQSQLEMLLERWHQSHELYIPVRHYGEAMLMPYGHNTLDLNYINFAQPVKEFFLKGREKLFHWNLDSEGIRLESPKEDMKSRILFGLRACDVHGMEYVDRFYLGEFCDDLYRQNRARTLLVALNCTDTDDKCFCDSVSAGPFANSGYDLLLTPLAEDYLVEVGTKAGQGLLELAKDYLREAKEEQFQYKNAAELETKARFKNIMKCPDRKATLAANFKNPIWHEMAETCIRCGGCTNVCPTCTCYNVVEEKTDQNTGTRIRSWDSCQSDSFTTNAGGHKPRTAISRVRYRIYDKLAYIEERFGYKGCTGCGRCITACPVDIDIVAIMNRLEKGPQEDKVHDDHQPIFDMAEVVAHAAEGHQKCENVHLPHIAVITSIVQETHSIKRFYLQYEDKSLHENFKFGGQFFEITVFGVGEIAISIPFGTEQREVFDFCVKNVGKVTKVMHQMAVGDKVGLRGPFGKGFPVEAMHGRDLLIIGSGVGVAPVRTAILQVLEKRAQYGKVSIVGSALNYESLIYKEDFIRWSGEKDLNVQYALNKSTDLVPAFVGRINDLLPKLDNDWNNTTAIICASPNRIREVAKDLLKLGMEATQIFTSLETHMRCGLGKCGHCKVGDKYMCVDGPVFNYEEMQKLPPEF